MRPRPSPRLALSALLELGLHQVTHKALAWSETALSLGGENVSCRPTESCCALPRQALWLEGRLRVYLAFPPSVKNFTETQVKSSSQLGLHGLHPG